MNRAFYFIVSAMLISACCANSSNSSNLSVSDNPVLEIIYTRTSVRSYLDKPVEPEKVDALLRAGMSAPTARNLQPWHFVVVDSKKQLQALAATNKYGGMIAKAALAIVVCGTDPQSDWWVQDCSAATQNILLAANALGLGAVWTGGYPKEDRVQGVSEVLGLPSDVLPLNVIVIGYPDSENTPKDKFKPENISYNTYKGQK